MLKRIFDFTHNKFRILEERLRENVVIIPNIKRSIQTDNYSCAVQSVYTLLDYYNISKSHTEIAQQLGTTKEDGTDTDPILDYLRSFNLDVSVNERASISDIKDSIRKQFPLLITIDDWEHWVLIYGYSDERIFLIDSNKKRLLSSMSSSEFHERWDDTWIAVIGN